MKGRRKQWRADALRSARENHIWLNAFWCLRPSEEFCAKVGREILARLNNPDLTILSENQLVGNERELVIRINKS